MTDLLRVLPNFPVGQYAALLPALDDDAISTCDLLTLDPADVAKRTRLPLPHARRLCAAVLRALHADLDVFPPAPAAKPASDAGPDHPRHHPEEQQPPVPVPAPPPSLRNTAASLAARWQTITTLDPALDRALAGGIPAGYVTEITGESGAGKTQFLLSLLLAVQLPPPLGLGRPALYVSTEAPLSTRRLAQMLAANPLFRRLPPADRPSLDRIISTVTPDLESQDHILTFQVPVEVARRGIGLIVLDSVAANYRAEFDRSAASSTSSSSRQGFNMGARSAELVRLGMHLRDLAQRHNLAVVVANQVADRFTSQPHILPSTTVSKTPASSLPRPRSPRHQTQESPLATRSATIHQPPSHPSHHPQPNSQPSQSHNHPTPSHNQTPQPPPNNLPPLLLDHQQNFFTGWGDTPPSHSHSHYPTSPPGGLKTPSLGLVWTTQLAARIALFRRPVARRYQPLRPPPHERQGGGDAAAGVGGSGWERRMKVVFAPHVPESGPGLEGAVGFEVWMGGLRGLGGDAEVEVEVGGVEAQQGGKGGGT
ncbi:DNA repair protein RAD57 [Staphylotrichum tortipilum]|uniref:DNA repair protein RAD57 n=1 Tax=Staphylotrichum tortipilum TaxID=2831512 RepID=A0AAN6RSF4_9PEZI|nr:DNA repair protein RAD57 [Staphylotrichum longicolle]